jgi:hypothetical protein
MTERMLKRVPAAYRHLFKKDQLKALTPSQSEGRYFIIPPDTKSFTKKELETALQEYSSTNNICVVLGVAVKIKLTYTIE